LIFGLIGRGSRVLDLGCGSGKLMEALRVEKGADCTGIDRDPAMVSLCMARQLKVFNLDFNHCMPQFKEDSYDHVLLTNSLQESRIPEKVIDESLRVGRSVILGFPNFGNFRSRIRLFFGGRAPVTESLPGQWYDTRNVRFLTVRDFEIFARDKGLRILKRTCSPRGLPASALPNLFAEYAIFRIREGG